MPVTSTTMPPEVARFWVTLARGDVDTAMAEVADDAVVTIPPAEIAGGRDEAQAFFSAAVTAFPDLLLTHRTDFVGQDGTAVSELKFEGTQAADFLDIVNQEKHVDVDQVWLLGTADGRITSIHAMWDQNQLYRRLGVKRLDAVSIV